MRTYPQSKPPQNCDEKIPLVREGKHLKREDKKMTYTMIEQTAAKAVYIVKNFQGMTTDEIADKIDCNNWGYYVNYTTPNEMKITIWKD